MPSVDGAIRHPLGKKMLLSECDKGVLFRQLDPSREHALRRKKAKRSARETG
jgi:hypothetical protein